jgi:5-carboxymethyl-2-hydroxymuconate isomerase
MPHFVIHCSSNVLLQAGPWAILGAVHDAAEATGLFAKGDIKVRLLPFEFGMYRLGEDKADFVHVFAHIMEGRTTEQKADLSRRVVQRLDALLPGLDILSMNVDEFERATYCNKSMIGKG